jgi:serine/threonine-protein kinase
MAALRIGQVIGGRWTLERLLGTGAAAAVYAARGPDGQTAAVKLLHPEMSEREEVRSRFLREGSTASRVTHPGVVEVIEQGASDPESAYIVMELLEGEPLSERLKRERGLPLLELLDYTAQILEVLVVAHAEGVVHRDLKPGNLFITAEWRACSIPPPGRTGRVLASHSARCPTWRRSRLWARPRRSTGAPICSRSAP